MKSILSKIHQFPQILIARRFEKQNPCRYLCQVDGVKVFIIDGMDGISLGDSIFINPEVYEGTWLVKHEFGHVIQSRILGWLYVPIILIPSFLWYKTISWFEKKLKWEEEYAVRLYYKFYTESWANKLVKI